MRFSITIMEKKKIYIFIKVFVFKIVIDDINYNYYNTCSVLNNGQNRKSIVIFNSALPVRKYESIFLIIIY